MDGALHVEAVGRDQVHVDLVLEGLAVQLHHRDDRAHPLRVHLRGADLVGHVGDDLEPDPEPRRAREHEAVQPQVQDLLHVARVEGRHERVVEGDLGGARQGRRLRKWIIPRQREHPAVLAHPRVVGVLEQVAGAVHPGGLAVPHADHAVVLGLREESRHLAAVHRGGAQVLVEARGEHHVVGLQQHRQALEGLVEASQRRAPVAGDERRGIETTAEVRAMLIERQPHQGLDAGQEDASALLGILRLERELPGLCGHELPFGGTAAFRTS